MLYHLILKHKQNFYKIDLNILVLTPLLILSLPIVFYNDNKRYNIQDAFFVMGVIFFLGFAFHNIIYMAKIDVYKCIFIFLVSFTYIALVIVSAKIFEKKGKEASRKFIHIMLGNWWIIAMIFFNNDYLLI